MFLMKLYGARARDDDDLVPLRPQSGFASPYGAAAAFSETACPRDAQFARGRATARTSPRSDLVGYPDQALQHRQPRRVEEMLSQVHIILS